MKGVRVLRYIGSRKTPEPDLFDPVERIEANGSCGANQESFADEAGDSSDEEDS